MCPTLVVEKKWFGNSVAGCVFFLRGNTYPGGYVLELSVGTA